MTIDLRPVGLVIGLLLSVLSLTMTLPMVLDMLVGHPGWQSFAASGTITALIGLSLLLTCRTGKVRLTVRQTFAAIGLGWIAVAVFAAIPFLISGLGLSPSDSFFEAMSGITTTGATVLEFPGAAPPGILLWRALLQWLGGIGVIVMGVAVLPLLNIGGMQIFRVESGETTDQAMPRAARMATSIGLIYAGLTMVLIIALALSGMTGFEAVIHAMTTISTGGFSTTDASIGGFDNPRVEIILTIGMIWGALPFTAFLLITQGRLRVVWRDQQIRGFLAIALMGAFGLMAWLWVSADLEAGAAIRHGWFTAISIMTGTGFYTLDYSAWAGLPLAILFFLALIGGCAGSTTAGIRVFRVQILFANARAQTRKLLRPNAIVIPYFNRHPISDNIAESVMGFLFVYALTFAILAMSLGFLGLDFVTSISGAAAAIANVGPALGGTIGPGLSYGELPEAAKWLLAGGMLLGRLEMFTLLVLFIPRFWRP